MRENLPKEIDFRHEARNAQRAEEDFKNVRTSLYIRMFPALSYRVLMITIETSQNHRSEEEDPHNGIYPRRSTRRLAISRRP